MSDGGGGGAPTEYFTGGAPTKPFTGGEEYPDINDGAFLLNLLRRQEHSQSSSLLPPQPISGSHVDPAVTLMGPHHTLPYNLFPRPPINSSHVDPASHMFFHPTNEQQFVRPPLNYHQGFGMRPNQGFNQAGGVNGGIREELSNVNLMGYEYDGFKRRNNNQQQIGSPMNLNINIANTGNDFDADQGYPLGVNQGYPLGGNGSLRGMYTSNMNANDFAQINNNVSRFNHHEMADLSGNHGYFMRNQRGQDAPQVFDGFPQRERGERRFQRHVHPPQRINQLPLLDNHQGFNPPNRANLNGNGNFILNAHSSRDLGKRVIPNPIEIEDSYLPEENSAALHKLEISSYKSEDGFVASSSDNTKEAQGEEDLPTEQVSQSAALTEEKHALLPTKNFVRNKEFRFDSRGQNVSSQRIRVQRRAMPCRRDIDLFAPAFISIFETLIPSSVEMARQSDLINSLRKVIGTEWPHARLHVYGSCANYFGVANCDIDLCLSINTDLEKPEIIVKLAEILEAAHFEILQALPRARVPIVKVLHPESGISCDICINNTLALVNTKLLKDYAMIDCRLRQLAFIVKHWAKSRRVNDAYQGTLSSYSYVIMCIYYLQTRRPCILPCLQALEMTFVAEIDGKKYGFYDKVENFRGIGARNGETISSLLWGFFHYWAFQHDYTSDVISIRTGSIISKHEKDWTRRVGNDRHLICIEDPFETSHDLGRVVDKFTIKTLREEFERAANVLQFDPNPTVALFEKYIPPPKVEENVGEGLVEGLNIH